MTTKTLIMVINQELKYEVKCFVIILNNLRCAGELKKKKW